MVNLVGGGGGHLEHLDEYHADPGNLWTDHVTTTGQFMRAFEPHE